MNCSIIGWWNQPDFHTLAIVKNRAGVVSIDNSHVFSGILFVHKDGHIDESVSLLIDKNGLATLSNARIDLIIGTISFIKTYVRRNDSIFYQASYVEKDRCWRGEFNGEATGHGTTAFVIQELPDSLFVED